jgi:hypothetical protein
MDPSDHGRLLPDFTGSLDRDALLDRTMQRAAVLGLARRRRRRLLQVVPVSVLVVALAITSVTVLVSRDDRGSAVVPGGRSSTTVPSAQVSLTPKGWVPVDFGDVQISVPASWHFVDPQACSGGARDTVYVNFDVAIDCPHIPLGRGPSVALDVARCCYSPGPLLTINGIHVVQAYGSQDFLQTNRRPPLGAGQYITLGVGIQLIGADAAAILRTLTYSPRAVALRAGKAPAVAGSWRWMTEPGWRVAVPPGWLAAGRKVGPLPFEGVCQEPYVAFASSPWGPMARIDNDSYLATTAHCPAYRANPHPPAPRDGVIVDVKPLPGWPGGTQVCRELNGLRACIVGGLPSVDILFVWVRAPGRPGPMLLEIGLAGTGMTARTVLDSLQAVKTVSLSG